MKVVEELGKKASGFCADLRIATIDSRAYRIEEYDGRESVVVASDMDWCFILE